MEVNGWLCYSEATRDNVKNLDKTLNLLAINDITGVLNPGTIYSYRNPTNTFLVLRAFLNGKYSAINLIVYRPTSKICNLHTIWAHRFSEITLVK